MAPAIDQAHPAGLQRPPLGCRAGRQVQGRAGGVDQLAQVKAQPAALLGAEIGLLGLGQQRVGQGLVKLAEPPIIGVLPPLGGVEATVGFGRGRGGLAQPAASQLGPQVGGVLGQAQPQRGEGGKASLGIGQSPLAKLDQGIGDGAPFDRDQLMQRVGLPTLIDPIGQRRSGANGRLRRGLDQRRRNRRLGGRTMHAAKDVGHAEEVPVGQSLQQIEGVGLGIVTPGMLNHPRAVEGKVNALQQMSDLADAGHAASSPGSPLRGLLLVPLPKRGHPRL